MFPSRDTLIKYRGLGFSFTRSQGGTRVGNPASKSQPSQARQASKPRIDSRGFQAWSSRQPASIPRRSWNSRIQEVGSRGGAYKCAAAGLCPATNGMSDQSSALPKHCLTSLKQRRCITKVMYNALLTHTLTPGTFVSTHTQHPLYTRARKCFHV